VTRIASATPGKRLEACGLDRAVVSRDADGRAIRSGQRVRSQTKFRDHAHNLCDILLGRVGFHNDQHKNLLT
jgi:hypothetical protein